MYMPGAVDTDNTDCAEERVDHYWTNFFQEEYHQGNFKYSILQNLVKSLLFLAHSNRDVERSLSINKNTVTPDRVSLSDMTINGLGMVKDHVKLYGEPHNVHITRELLQQQEKHPKHMEKGSQMKKN